MPSKYAPPEPASAEPNEAHRALARLEAGLVGRGNLFLVTQNIDDLHERAGSERVIHMHGELLKARCIACSQVSSWHEDLSVDVACPHCGRIGPFDRTCLVRSSAPDGCH